MRTETITKTYLTFNELNDKQKAKVLDKHRYWNVDFNEWHDSTFEGRKAILELLGFSNVKIEYSGFSSQGDGACFTGSFNVPKTKKELKQRIKLVKDYAPKFDVHGFGSMIFDKKQKEDGTLKVYKVSQRYSHSNTVSTENDDLTAFVRAFSDQLYKDLSNEYDYLTTDESVRESIEANELEFDLDQLSA